jgi:hypothetical protein
MTERKPKPTIAWVPAFIGLLLWMGATALLVEDAFHGHFTITHLLQPLLTAGTISAAVICHHRIASLRLLSGSAFLLLAVLGSLATVYATLSRTAAGRDVQQAEAMAENRTLSLKEDELVAAKALAKKECVVIGVRCREWNQRVDQLTKEMAPLRAGMNHFRRGKCVP